MVTLSNGVEIPDEDIPEWGVTNYRCFVHPMFLAVSLHHEPPRSMGGTKGYPLCLMCHEKVHSMTRKDARLYLRLNL